MLLLCFNSQNDLFQVHIKIHIFKVLLGLISFVSLSDSLQLVLSFSLIYDASFLQRKIFLKLFNHQTDHSATFRHNSFLSSIEPRSSCSFKDTFFETIDSNQIQEEKRISFY